MKATIEDITLGTLHNDVGEEIGRVSLNVRLELAHVDEFCERLHRALRSFKDAFAK